MRDEEHILRKVLRIDTQGKRVEKTTENKKERRSEKGRSKAVPVNLVHHRGSQEKRRRHTYIQTTLICALILADFTIVYLYLIKPV